MKQMEEQMKSDLSSAQSEEASSAAAFAELREAKQSEIANGEKMAETKEDELAQTDNALAEAKEDIGEEKKTLAADTEFLANMDSTCAEADKNFAERKQARLSEIQAVSETIEILQGDDARDAMSSTYNGASFLQTSATKDSRRRPSPSRMQTRQQQTRHWHSLVNAPACVLLPLRREGVSFMS